jgi:hypothetical protein
MDPVAQIKKLGWDWRSDGMGLGLGPGVVLSVQVDNRTMRAFVPLSRVFLAFDEQLQAVGCVGCASVGEPFSVGGFFSFVKKAAKSIGKAAASVVPKAIRNAASTVVNTAAHFGGAALNLVNKIPVLGTITKAASSLALLPANAASQLLQGKRIDHIALDQFKSALGSVKTLAPYVQTVLTFVPGVGTGLSAGIGGALALASGQNITDALMSAAKSALPGGPISAAAFSVASDAMQGKPLTTIALDAIPGVSPSAKSALIQGLAAARDLAAGKNVSQLLIDNALHQLPPAAQKAVQIGVALGHAKNLQQAAGAAVNGAAQLAAHSQAGQHAAQLFAQGVRTAPVLQAMNNGRAAQNALATVVAHAQAGHQQAQKVVSALQMFRNAPQAPRAPAVPANVAHLVRSLQHLGPQSFFPRFA